MEKRTAGWAGKTMIGNHRRNKETLKGQKIRNVGTAVGAFYAVTYLIVKFTDVNVTQSWVYLLAYAGMIYILKIRLSDNRQVPIGNRGLCILALLLSITIITGIYFDHGLPFEKMTVDVFMHYLICIIGFMPLCQYVFVVVFRWIGAASCREQNTDKKEINKLIMGGGYLLLYWAVGF